MINKALTLAFIFITTVLFGQSRVQLSQEAIQRISSELTEKTNKIHCVEANFIQEKVLSFMEEKLIAQGKFWFSIPDKIRWEYEKPYPYLIIMFNGKMSISDEGDSYSIDMRSNQMFQQMNSLITKSIQGQLLAEELDYDKQYFEDAKNYIVCFYPKDQQLKAYLSAIEIYFDKESKQVSALKMIEIAGDYTFIRFSNRKENNVMNQEIFSPISNK